MSTLKDGGQAFPRSYAFLNPETGTAELKSVEGMSLRDYFAAQALNGFLASTNARTLSAPYSTLAYEFADAMLKAREAKS